MAINKIPELLCPAGDLTRLCAAVDYGADAVYLAGEEFGMRTAAANFGEEDLKKGIEYAHKHGVKVHIACNVIPHNEEIARLPEFLKTVNALGADALIAADIGTIGLIKKYAPDTELHVSVQSGICNYETANAFYNMGAKRVVLARELSLAEIAEIRAKTPQDLELEAFAHGAMCVSFSARCLLSSYMTGRDANRGDCAQPCRWSYSLMEEKRPGQYFDITETDKGTYILNANDLCMAEQLDKMAAAGVSIMIPCFGSPKVTPCSVSSCRISATIVLIFLSSSTLMIMGYIMEILPKALARNSARSCVLKISGLVRQIRIARQPIAGFSSGSISK